MTTKRKRHSGEFKAKVALEALKGLKTVNELGAQYGVHLTQISQWKRRLGVEAKEIFGSRRLKEVRDQELGCKVGLCSSGVCPRRVITRRCLAMMGE